MPLSPREQRVLALQISLDRRGFSCNTLDGQCGRKTQVALATYCAVNGLAYVPGAEATAHARFFAGETNLFETVVVTAADHAACGRIPAAPAEEPAGALPEGSSGKALSESSNEENASRSSSENAPESSNEETASRPSSEELPESSNEKTAE